MRGRNKYNNKKITLGEHTFDSFAESRYYLHLLDLQREGIVTDIQMQVPFVLREAFEHEGVKYRAMKYVADFVVAYADGTERVIDVKGKVLQTFRDKRKLFVARYNRPIVCVKRKGREWIEF